jgi:hypothetical protein
LIDGSASVAFGEIASTVGTAALAAASYKPFPEGTTIKAGLDAIEASL